MKEGEEIAARFGGYADWNDDEIVYLIGELARGIHEDQGFDGYWGASRSLSAALDYIEHGDTMEGDKRALGYMHSIANYALNSVWHGTIEGGDSQEEFTTLEAVEVMRLKTCLESVEDAGVRYKHQFSIPAFYDPAPSEEPPHRSDNDNSVGTVSPRPPRG